MVFAALSSLLGPQKLLSRIITGDGLRKTRFHSYNGNLIDIPGLAYLPSSALSTFLLKTVGYRQQTPWLGYRAVRRLRTLLQPEWKALEFGSGMSSLFLAKRCKTVVSIESDKEWHGRVKALLAERGLSNVDFRFRGPDDYARVDDCPDASFDFALIDGIQRDLAARTAIRKCKPGAWILLDNSDVQWPEHQEACRILLEAAAGRGSVEVYNDLHPFNLQVCESMPVRLPE